MNLISTVGAQFVSRVCTIVLLLFACNVRGDFAGGMRALSAIQFVGDKVRADAGDSEAQWKVANYYKSGFGCETNLIQAAIYYRRAAEQGYWPAQWDLGVCYEKGEGVVKDSEIAAKWYRKAAESGDPEAQFTYGALIVTNKAEKALWYEKAAEQGHTQAALWLAWLYKYEELRTKEESSAEIVRWYSKAAGAGNDMFSVIAQDSLGDVYSQGELVPQDLSKAFTWYNCAAKNQSSSAQFALGAMYRDGKGVEQDLPAAAKWFTRAAEHGHSEAQAGIAELYKSGRGVEKDYTEAYAWFNIAARKASDSDASTTKSRAELEGKMTPEQIARAQERTRELLDVIGASVDESDPKQKARGKYVDAEPHSFGTGFFITTNGYLLTAFHVIEDAERIHIRSGARRLPAVLVAADKANDVALLKAVGQFPCLKLASSRSVRLGCDMFTVGFPNVSIQGSAPKYTSGSLSSLSGIEDDPRHFQISVPVQPGNSGGPLLDSAGNVVGVIVTRLSDRATFTRTGALPQNVNYAVKSSFILAFLENAPEVSKFLSVPKESQEAEGEAIIENAREAVVLVMSY